MRTQGREEKEFLVGAERKRALATILDVETNCGNEVEAARGQLKTATSSLAQARADIAARDRQITVLTDRLNAQQRNAQAASEVAATANHNAAALTDRIALVAAEQIRVLAIVERLKERAPPTRRLDNKGDNDGASTETAGVDALRAKALTLETQVEALEADLAAKTLQLERARRETADATDQVEAGRMREQQLHEEATALESRLTNATRALSRYGQ